MLLGTSWALCPCGPSPWPFLKKDSPKYSSQMWNEWEFSCIAQMKQPFPLKYTHGSQLGASKILYPLCSNSTSWKLLQLFFFYNVSPCPEKAQRCARGLRMCFLENHLRLNWKEKEKKKRKKEVSCFTSYREEFHHMWSSGAKWILCLCSWCFQQQEPFPVLAPNSEPALVGLKRRRHTNWLEADSCVNKARSGYWKLANLHKVCLREGRKGRLWWKEEVSRWTKPLEFLTQCSLRRIIQRLCNSIGQRRCGLSHETITRVFFLGTFTASYSVVLSFLFIIFKSTDDLNFPTAV